MPIPPNCTARGYQASLTFITLLVAPLAAARPSPPMATSMQMSKTAQPAVSSGSPAATPAASGAQSVNATASPTSDAQSRTAIPAPAPTAPSSPNDVTPQPDVGSRVCGLGAAFHAGRRAKLVETLRAQSPTGLVLVRGLPASREYVRFSQDKTFWYLTGVESPNAALVIDVKTGAETLFLPPRSTANERWEGELWDAQDAWVKDLTGFTDVRPTNELVPMLKDSAPAAKVVWISKEPWVELSGCSDRAGPHDSSIEHDPLDGRMSREDALELNLQQKLGVEVRDCAPVLAEMRRIKTPEEIGALRRAGRIGALAMEEAVRCSRPGRGEWELEAVMSFVHRREGAAGPAYHAIVGCGPDSIVLHYAEDSRTMRAGEIVLLDYAPEVDHYTSDITRSWPVDGRFTPRMIELYDAVLEAQLAGIAAVKPGATFEDVEKACRHALSTHGMLKLVRHGVSHYVGLEVHDVGDYRRPLEPGVVITVEPGLYDAQANIGIRIEDVVLVTAVGCDVLTAGVTKDRAALGALQAEEGILDRKGGTEGPRGPVAVENPGKH
jgi:Xaa-Pro aminopeptidase